MGHFLPQFGTQTGTGSAVRELLEGCQSQPHIKHIVYSAAGYKSRSENVETVHFDRGTARGWSSVVKRIARNSDKIDFITIHHPFSLINLIISSVSPVPILYFPHGCFAQDTLNAPGKKAKKMAYGLLVEKRIIRKCVRVICSTASEALDLSKYARCETTVIPFPWSRPVSDRSGELDTSNSGMIKLLYIGRIDVHVKGLDTLIQAVSMARQSGANVSLRIAGYGDPSNEQALEDLISEHGEAGAIEFIGPVYGLAKAQEIAKADLYCQLSRFESFGMSIVEALACGKPALLSQGVALASELESVGCARVVAKNSIESTARAIAALGENHELRRQMGQAGASWVKTELDPQATAAKTAKLLEAIAKG